MIQLLATTHQKKIAALLYFLFGLSFGFTPLSYAGGIKTNIHYRNGLHHPDPVARVYGAAAPETSAAIPKPGVVMSRSGVTTSATRAAAATRPVATSHPVATSRPAIGGPSQPEMTSFKAVDAGNLVNLFTGDFSYNISLLDVGGYPVNIYYNGGISSEQEASWVGLGWNINPGNINRNMRGIPDDFDGTDMLKQTQNMKPNKTWGVNVAGDLEGVGIKALSLGLNLGVSFNNYLGPALDLGVKGGLNFKIAGKATPEKSAPDSTSLNLGLNLGIGISADLNSREGLTISPNVSLAASGFKQNASFSEGVSLATSYNSRSGIKALQISEQSSLNSLEQQRRDGQGNYGSISESHFGTAISFARPSYIPAIRMPMTNGAFSGRFQLGGGIFGIYGSLEAEVYEQTSEVTPGKIVQQKPMVGYLYYEKAMTDPNAVMDFTRFNDKEITSHTPIISAPQYSYDVFTIQGEGTGGSIRAYRNEPGLVRDNHTGSQDKNTGVGADVGIPGHYGLNVNIVRTPTDINTWTAGNNIQSVLAFKPPATGKWENVYFRNPGEACVLENTQYDPIGGTDLVRFQLSGDPHNPNVVPVLDRFSKAGVKTGTVNVATTAGANGRRRRTQVIDFLTAADASLAGLDKMIKSYDYQTFLDNSTNNLRYTSIPRVGGYRKPNHISQINVTESNGKRYIYGVPVYNIRQKDFTFTVNSAASNLSSPSTLDKVPYTTADADPLQNPNITGSVGSRDGYVQITETPAYAHSFLLSGLLSSDYVDVTGDGITDDDLGNAVKFNYSQIKQPDGNTAVHAWRSPSDANANMANFNAGKRTETKDDKGLVSYGERESWYLHSIESKTMIALFTLEDRQDGKGVSAVAGQSGENAGINSADASIKRLKQIDLYNKSDLKKNGIAKARAIKTIHFAYSYKLCNNTPDNPVGDVTGKGKLTLDSIYFTYNNAIGQTGMKRDKYVFSYGSTPADNPSYAFNASDRWNVYKPATMNPADKTTPNMKNSDYPYTIQERPGKLSPRTTLDQNAGAWSLKNIVLPSGGQIDVTYESDDYAYVQNRHAAEMMNIVGFSSSPTGTISNRLYDLAWGSVVENNVVFIQVPQPCASDAEVATRYLQGMDQLALKIGVDMPSGVEYVSCYANIVNSGKLDATTIWVRLKPVSGISPLSLTAVEFLREQLPGQAFPGYDVSDGSGLQQIGEALAGMLAGLKDAFKDPVMALRSKGKAQTVELGQSFARLNNPLGVKYGGGHRVKKVALKDNWQAMTQQFSSVYAKTYDYTTTESFNGATRVISSGVASYEPSVGGDENPFETIVQVADKLPLGPVSYGAVEMPVLEAFFPAADIGYSKVTVRSVPSVTPTAQQKSRSGIGRQVTEYYTAKDYPVYYSQTSLDPSTDLQAHNSSTTNFFHKYAFDSRALSQGFLVEVNDMHGKLRSQTSYAENDTTIRVNYTESFYRNTGSNGLNETFSTISSAQGGLITPGNIGIDIELMTDVRQFTVNSSSMDVQAQVDLFPVYLPFWLPFIWPVTGSSENDYRAVTTTKVISYHAILDSQVVYDKGSQIGTKNLVFDGETGNVIVNRTNNAFNQPVYHTSYPAWWAYAGMGPAYVNTGVTFGSLTFSDGKLIAGTYDPSLFISGDELYLTNLPSSSSCPPLSSPAVMLWTLDKNKKNPSFPISSPDLIFIDGVGNPYTYTANLRILRSGYRNMLDETLANVSSMVSPIVVKGSTLKLSIDSTSSVINASATEFGEKWQTDKDAFRTYTTVFDQGSCTSSDVPDCNGNLEKVINPYRKGLLGNFRASRNMVFYANRMETDPAVGTNLPQNGFLANFSLYWDFNASNQLVPNTTSTWWVERARTTRVNARSLQLETKDAMGVYTSALYGYNKTLPIAITNNSPYSRMVYEGFEDYNYSQDIDNSQLNPCLPKQLDFTTMPGTSVVNTDGLSFSAHTGKYVLAMPNNSSGTINVPITAADNLNFTFSFGSTTAQVLNNPGINFSMSPAFPNAIYDNGNPPTAGSGPTQVIENVKIVSLAPPTGSTTVGHSFGSSWDGYFLITHKDIYNFTMGVSSNYSLNSTNVNNYSMSNDVRIYGPDGSMVSYQGVYTSASHGQTNISQSASVNYSVTLCPGFYHVTGVPAESCVTTGSPGGSSDQFRWSCSNCGSDLYKSITASNTCTTTVPIAGDPTMLNPVFSMPAGQPMLFSAWVRDGQAATATGVTDTAVTYYNSVVRIYDGSQYHDLSPQGPIIEGWQRYEGSFTPATAGTASIGFLNNGPNTLYIDDIRLHPFNASMASYVYDQVNQRMVAKLDANNYATFYEFDEDGTLIRTKTETQKGIKTINETRASLQKNILANQSRDGSSCGPNCTLAAVQNFAGVITLGYPMGVFNVNGKLLGNATSQTQYVSLWNADTADAGRGVLSAGIDTLHFQLAMNTGKAVPILTGARYCQMDVSDTAIRYIDFTNCSYVDFGDGYNMRIPRLNTDAVLPPNTFLDYPRGGPTKLHHVYPNTSTKTITLYHNDQNEGVFLTLDSLTALHAGNLRGMYPQNATTFALQPFNEPNVYSMSGFTNWNSIHSISKFGTQSSVISPATNGSLHFAQDFMAANTGLTGINITAFADSTFKLHRFKTDWNAWFTNLTTLAILEDNWDHEDLSTLIHLQFIEILRSRIGKAMTSQQIDNLLMQVARGAGLYRNNGIIYIMNNVNQRTSASDDAYNFLIGAGWEVTIIN